MFDLKNINIRTEEMTANYINNSFSQYTFDEIKIFDMRTILISDRIIFHLF